MLQVAELSDQADSEFNLGGSSETMYYIGLDVHKKTISFCVKDAAGRVESEGKIGSTRCELSYGSSPRTCSIAGLGSPDQRNRCVLAFRTWLTRAGRKHTTHTPGARTLG